jgi:hypothetical protein
MSTVIDSVALLGKLEEQVEKHLLFCIQQLQNTEEAVLLNPSTTGGWSIAQCLWHLNSYGHYYLPLIGDKMKTARQPASTFVSTWLGRYFIKIMLPETGKKYKAFKDHVPPPQLNAYEEVAEFIRQQETLLRLLKQAKQTDMNRVKIPISISPLLRLRLGDVFQFIVAHDERHLQQAARNLSK